jgi:hypothetical protein
MHAAGVDSLSEPTLSSGETLAELRKDPTVTDLDPDAAGQRASTRMPLASAAMASSSSTSWPSSTSSAPADRRRLPIADCPAIIKRHRRRPSPCKANGCTCCLAQRSRLVAKSVRGTLGGRPVETNFAAVRVPPA